MKYDEPSKDEKKKQDALMGQGLDISKEEAEAINDLVQSEAFKYFENIVREEMSKAGLAVLNMQGDKEDIIRQLHVLQGKYATLLYIKKAIKNKHNAAKQKGKKNQS